MARKSTTSNPGDVKMFPSAEAVAQGAAELFAHTCDTAVRERGRFYVALSGGSTPKRTFELLSSEPLRSRINWDHVHLFWGDERYVPHDDPNSNYRMTSEALLRHIPVPPANIHGVPTELSPPETAAAAYEADVRQTLGTSDSSIPRFDLVYLGVGTNGHTASLFPHSPVLKETSRLVVADFVAEVNSWRISMTAPLLNRGRTVAFLVAGREKASVLKQVMFGPRNVENLPAQLISPEGELLWLLDEAAASMLPHTQASTAAPHERAS
jgi:6-phosphogluconolactonase